MNVNYGVFRIANMLIIAKKDTLYDLNLFCTE